MNVLKMLFRTFGVTISVLGMISLMYMKSFWAEPDRMHDFFSGAGTEKSPYIIDTYEKLQIFRDEVNEGNSFEGQYFLQTTNIDLKNEEWSPIGIYGSGKYFLGVYDGGGHYIENICISSSYPYYPANVGFFGYLGGTVKNLGIESGSIEGDYVGALSSHGADSCLILNCYNKANVVGRGRAGGICDNVGFGSVINCVNLGEVTAPSVGIVSYNAGYVTAVFPVEFPDTFNGVYYSIEINGNSEEELLNNGLNQLMTEKVLERKEATWW